jgi:hypothetical protein
LAIFVLLTVVAVAVFAIASTSESSSTTVGNTAGTELTAEKLYQQALAYKQSQNFPEKDFAIIKCCKHPLPIVPSAEGQRLSKYFMIKYCTL